VAIVDALAEKLDARLREWKPETAAEARERIMEVIVLADQDVLDLDAAETYLSVPLRDVDRIILGIHGSQTLEFWTTN